MIVYDGLNNLTWFMGIIEDVSDPTNGGRVKIRAFGFHPTVEADTVGTDDLPWASVLGTSPHMHIPLDRGEFVFGAFLDGRDAQQPLVFGTIPAPKFGIPVSPGGGGAADSGQVGSSGVSGFASGSTESILETIKQRESKGNYSSDAKIKDPKASASGAYQFIDSTWRAQTKAAGVGTQYARAVDAPPAIQDAVAAHYVNNILATNGNNLAAVPITWYTGNAAGKMSAEAIARNNGLTADKYAKNWLADYNKVTGSNTAPTVSVSTNPYAKTTNETIENFGNKALPPQATGEDIHKTPAGSAMTNSKSYNANGLSLSHPGVPVGGGYKTGVWNARYDGSYIEMHAGSSKSDEHISVVHRSGSHIVLDQNGNITIMSSGRVHISSLNDLEQHVEGFSTNVSRGGYSVLVDGGGLSLSSTGDINISSNSNVNIAAGGNIVLHSGGSADIVSGKIGITSEQGIVSVTAAQNIAFQSAGDISHKAVNMAINASGILGIESIGNTILKGKDVSVYASGILGVESKGNTVLKGQDVTVYAAGKLNQKGAGGSVLEGSTLGLKSSGYATMQAGGFANIVGSRVNLNNGGSVDSVAAPETEVPVVITLDNTGGGTGAVSGPPPMGLGTKEKTKTRSPRPGSIAITDTDDVLT